MSGGAAHHVPERLTCRDLPGLRALEVAAQARPWTSQQLAEELAHADGSVWGIRSGDDLQGYAAYRRMHDELWLLNLAVHPHWRRGGVARALLARGLHLCREWALKELWLEVRITNVGARQLYTRFGFEEMGVRRGYYPSSDDEGGREDACLMRCVVRD